MHSMRIAWALIVGLALLAAVGAEADEKDILQNIGPVTVNWTAQYIEVSGEGTVPNSSEEPNRSKAFLKARTYAKMSAVAGVYAALDNVAVSSEATGKDFLTDLGLRSKVEGFVANVELSSEKKLSDTGDSIAAVTVRAPMFGGSGLMPAILEANDQMLSSNKKAKLDRDAKIDNSPSVGAQLSGPFSSLILDCAGLKLEPSVWPRLRRPNLSVVLPVGSIEYDQDKLSQHGACVYVSSQEEAKKQRRAGNKPLIIKGRARAGVKAMCDVVISDSDADRLLTENKLSEFIEKGNVILITDRSEED